MNALITSFARARAHVLVATSIAVCALAAAAVPAEAANPYLDGTPAPACVKKRVTPELREQLRGAFNLARGTSALSTGTVLIGKCQNDYFAYVAFDAPAGSTPEQLAAYEGTPDIFSTTAAADQWLHVGATGGVVECEDTVPTRLLQVWNVPCAEDLDGEGTQVFLARHIHGGSNRRCKAITFENERGNGFSSVSADGISCRKAHQILRDWHGNRLKPARGPKGWKCRLYKITVGDDRTRHACERGRKTLVFD